MRVRTFAKLNLYLKVFPLRADGYHDILSIMQTIDWSDEILFVIRGDELTIECGNPMVPLNENNTVAKVYNHLKNKYPALVRGVQVKIIKNIPLQSGLGGGSGNAAGAIVGLKELFKLPMEEADMLACAEAVGSDVPFMLKGGCAIVRGCGEVVEKLPGLAGNFFLVVVPAGQGVETAKAYGMIDEWRAGETHKIGEADSVYHEVRSVWLSALSRGEFQGLMHNDFEEPIFNARPDIAEVRDKLSLAGASAFMTGSGSVVFALVDDYHRALELLEPMRDAYGDGAYIWRAVPQGVELYD